MLWLAIAALAQDPNDQQRSDIARGRAPDISAIGPQDLVADEPYVRAAIEALNVAVDNAKVVEVAMARVQNDLAGFLRSGRWASCRQQEFSAKLSRQRTFGRAHRDAVQSARARLQRLNRLLQSATLTPEEHPDLFQSAKEAEEELNAQMDTTMEFMAWHSYYIEKHWWRCESVLGPLPGFGDVLHPDAPATGRTAVLGFGDGYLCPSGVPTTKSVIVLDEPKACWSASRACSCTPEPVFPGASLGPAPRSE